MGFDFNELQALDLWRRVVVTTVRRDAPDLTARQMALLLTVYMTPPPHTVRGLAEILNVSKPAVTRAVDRLSELQMLRRKATKPTAAASSSNAPSGDRFFYGKSAKSSPPPVCKKAETIPP